jgi:Myosin N-terminal SH3-like domain
MSGFEKDAAYPFLAIDRKKLLEEAPPYDAKTSCWIADEKLGYIRANITATKGEEVTVLTEKNEVRRHNSYCSCDWQRFHYIIVEALNPKPLHIASAFCERLFTWETNR